MNNIFRSLVIASVENVLNFVIFNSPILKTIYQRLNGRIFKLSLKELHDPIILLFNEHRINILDTCKLEIDCSLLMNLNVLIKLHDHHQLTNLINSGDIKIEGDNKIINMLRNFIELISNPNKFLLAESLAPYIGDILAEGFSSIFTAGIELLSDKIQRQQRYIAEMLIEELRLAPGLLEFTWFNEEINIVRNAVDKLDKRIANLR